MVLFDFHGFRVPQDGQQKCKKNESNKNNVKKYAPKPFFQKQIRKNRVWDANVPKSAPKRVPKSGQRTSVFMLVCLVGGTGVQGSPKEGVMAPKGAQMTLQTSPWDSKKVPKSH